MYKNLLFLVRYYSYGLTIIYIGKEVDYFMPYTPIEIIAVIFATLVIIKIIFVIFNKKAWYENVVKSVYNGSNSILLLILAAVLFYYSIKELSIVHIFAVMAFSGVLFGSALSKYSKEFLPLLKKIYSKELDAMQWGFIIIFLILAILVLKIVL